MQDVDASVGMREDADLLFRTAEFAAEYGPLPYGTVQQLAGETSLWQELVRRLLLTHKHVESASLYNGDC